MRKGKKRNTMLSERRGKGVREREGTGHRPHAAVTMLRVGCESRVRCDMTVTSSKVQCRAVQCRAVQCRAVVTCHVDDVPVVRISGELCG
jgi:hypothetical protein